MSLSYDHRVSVAPDVLIQELDGEAAILNLATQKYFGLDDMGLEIWKRLTSTESIQQAYDELLASYDVTPAELRRELDSLLAQLLEHRLIALGEF